MPGGFPASNLNVFVFTLFSSGWLPKNLGWWSTLARQDCVHFHVPCILHIVFCCWPDNARMRRVLCPKSRCSVAAAAFFPRGSRTIISWNICTDDGCARLFWHRAAWAKPSSHFFHRFGNRNSPLAAFPCNNPHTPISLPPLPQYAKICPLGDSSWGISHPPCSHPPTIRESCFHFIGDAKSSPMEIRGYGG